MAFDTIGPRQLGICSALCTALSFVLMGIALKVPCEAPGLLWASLLSFAVSNGGIIATLAVRRHARLERVATGAPPAR